MPAEIKIFLKTVTVTYPGGQKGKRNTCDGPIQLKKFRDLECVCINYKNKFSKLEVISSSVE